MHTPETGALQARVPPFVCSLFIPKGSQYYLATATATGELVEGIHFHHELFAWRGFLLSAQQTRTTSHWVVLYDWKGTVLDYCLP